MFIADIAAALWQHCGELLCHEDHCGVHDGAVGACDWCGKHSCLEHTDVLMNRDIDSDLMLCQNCGDKFDEQNGIVFDENGNPQIHGPPHSRDAELVRPRVNNPITSTR